jgi:hypothetical protein
MVFKSAQAGDRTQELPVNFHLFSFTLPLTYSSSSVTCNGFLCLSGVGCEPGIFNLIYIYFLSLNCYARLTTQLLVIFYKFASAGEQTRKLSVNFHQFSFTLLLSYTYSPVTGNW